MSILYGYQNRIAPTYWTMGSISWTGSMWTSAGTISGFTMTPQAAMGSSGIARFLIKVSGVLKAGFSYSPTHSHLYVLAGRSNEFLVPRFGIAVAQTVTVTLDSLSAVEISEIEVGFNGTF